MEWHGADRDASMVAQVFHPCWFGIMQVSTRTEGGAGLTEDIFRLERLPPPTFMEACLSPPTLLMECFRALEASQVVF